MEKINSSGGRELRESFGRGVTEAWKRNVVGKRGAEEWKRKIVERKKRGVGQVWKYGRDEEENLGREMRKR